MLLLANGLLNCHPGRVPLLVHGVGVLYRNFFGGDDGEPSDIFSKVTTAHELQSLTESDKAGRAHRTGIYLTPVTVDARTRDAHFRLLRCSSNLAGPTGAFAAVDEGLVGELVGNSIDFLLARVFA